VRSTGPVGGGRSPLSFGGAFILTPQIVKHYRTDTRLWLAWRQRLCGWFLPLQGSKNEQMAPAMFFVILGQAGFRRGIDRHGSSFAAYRRLGHRHGILHL
jgi:hypothetical protein